MNKFEKDWEDWIDHNISLGNCKQILFKKSLEIGYDYNLLKNKIGIDYIISDKTDNSNSNNNNNSNRSSNVALRNAVKLNSTNLEIYQLDNFLTKEECQEIINTIKMEKLVESSTYNASDPNNSQINDFRTSKTCYFYNRYPFINELESRICKTIGINNRYSETIQAQKYCVGEQFKLHTDYFDPSILKSNRSINGQRTWTFMIYLNEVEEGGHTSFPYAYISTKPKTGTAIMWNNLNNDNSENIYASHCGMPIIKGEKYILTKWFKETEINLTIRNEICSNHVLPIFHKTGFEKINLKLNSIEQIKKWMIANTHNFKKEEIIRYNDSADRNLKSNILNISESPIELQNELQNDFKKILTEWIGYKSELQHVATYGIREYTKGAILENHYDRVNTHVISAIIHLDDNTETPWELYIEDHNFKPHLVTMKYGDIVLYESTTCLHGRPTNFNGVSHKNMYIHFKPLRWDEYTKI